MKLRGSSNGTFVICLYVCIVTSSILELLTSTTQKFTLDGSVENRWTIGQGLMHIDSMFLVRLVSVSKGSFQPEIWVVDPSLPDAPLAWE